MNKKQRYLLALIPIYGYITNFVFFYLNLKKTRSLFCVAKYFIGNLILIMLSYLILPIIYDSLSNNISINFIAILLFIIIFYLIVVGLSYFNILTYLVASSDDEK